MNSAVWELVIPSTHWLQDSRGVSRHVHDIIKETCDVIWEMLAPRDYQNQELETGKELKMDFTQDGIFQITMVHWMESL